MPVAPRHATVWAFAVYLLCTLALAYPALHGGFLVSPISDQYIGGYAVRHFAAHALKTGHGLPLWNPYLFGGMPYVGAMNGDIFYPTFLLRMVLPTDVAMTWSFIIHMVLAGLFTYGFLRAMQFSFPAALLGGVAYLLGGPVASYAAPGHDGKLYVSALLPLMLWLLAGGLRRGRLWTWGALAVVVGLAVLSPHPQVLQYALLASGAFALYLAFGSRDGVRLERRLAIRRLAYAAGAVLLGALIGAVQYLPVLGYVGWSPRAGGRGFAYAATYSMPIEELFNSYLPQFTGILDHYWGRNLIHFHSEYLGATVLLLAGAGLLTRGAQRGFARFWIATGLVALVWALGGYTPMYHLVYALVPGTKFFRAPSTIFFLVSFAVAVLAALGVERVLARDLRERYAVGWIIFAVFVALVASAGGLTSIGAAIAGPDRYAAVEANNTPLIVGAWRAALFTVIAAAVVIAALRGRMTGALVGYALAAVVAADLWTVLRDYWIFSPPASTLYATDPTIEYVRGRPQPGRVLALPLTQDPASLGSHDPELLGDALMVHGVRIVLGYHGNQMRYYDELAGSAQGYAPALQNPNFWALANARYLLTNAPVPSLPKRVGPVRDAAGSTLYLYRLPGDNPAAWVAPLIVKAPDSVTLRTVLDRRFDVTRAAIFDTSAAVHAVTNVKALPPPTDIAVRVTRYDPGRISVQLGSPAPAGAALMVSENYYPGWTATADGKPAPIGRADYAFIGVQLPAGARSVDLAFHSSAYERGKVVTIVALALSLLTIVAGLAADRAARARRG